MGCPDQIGNVVLGIVAITALFYLFIYYRLVQIVKSKYPNL